MALLKRPQKPRVKFEIMKITEPTLRGCSGLHLQLQYTKNSSRLPGLTYCTEKQSRQNSVVTEQWPTREQQSFPLGLTRNINFVLIPYCVPNYSYLSAPTCGGTHQCWTDTHTGVVHAADTEKHTHTHTKTPTFVYYSATHDKDRHEHHFLSSPKGSNYTAARQWSPLQRAHSRTHTHTLSLTHTHTHTRCTESAGFEYDRPSNPSKCRSHYTAWLPLSSGQEPIVTH